MSDPERAAKANTSPAASGRARQKRHAIEAPGAWLAHYTSANTVFEKILPDQQLKMNPYRLMNDPVENKALPVPITSGPGLKALVKVHQFRDLVNAYRGDVRLTSLTRDVGRTVFGCCWARPRMWEQYADRHRGACLVFDQERLIAAMRSSPPAKGTWVPREVDYTRMGVAGWNSTTTLEKSAPPLNEFIVANMRELFFLKSDDWASEHEYRITYFPSTRLAGSDEPHFLPYRQALVAVVVGERFPEWQLEGAHRACRDVGIDLRQIEWRQGKPTTADALSARDARRDLEWAAANMYTSEDET